MVSDCSSPLHAVSTKNDAIDEPVRRVALLHSHLGSGHTRAAEAIGDGLRAREAEIELIDFWSLMDDRVGTALKQGYLKLVTRHPDAYQRLYRLDSDTWRRFFRAGRLPRPLPGLLQETIIEHFPEVRGHFPVTRGDLDQAIFTSMLNSFEELPAAMGGTFVRWGLVLWMYSLLMRRLAARLNRFNPDVVVATQIYPATLFAALRRTGNFAEVPGVAVTTDYGIHELWIRARFDHYCVAWDEIGAALIDAGLPPKHVHATGMPLSRNFSEAPDQAAARCQLGLDTSAPTVLITGGAYGFGVARAAKAVLATDSRWQVIATAGGCSRVLAELKALAFRHPRRLRVFGWTEDMALVTAAADAVVGKPGGLSVSEALACGRPFAAVCCLGGQESFNVQYLCRHRVGRRVQSSGELGEVLRNWLGCKSRLEAVQERARALGRPQATRRVVGLVSASRAQLCDRDGRWAI